jgi:Flp pilus assembly protein TadG
MTITLAKGRTRNGASAAELALLLPLLMLLILGCIDFGRFAYSYIAVSNAARAGAGYGAVNPYTNGTYATWQSLVRQAVVDEITQNQHFDPSQLTVTANGVSEGSGLWRAEVTASYPFRTVINWVGIPHTMTLRRTVVMRGIR